MQFVEYDAGEEMENMKVRQWEILTQDQKKWKLKVDATKTYY